MYGVPGPSDFKPPAARYTTFDAPGEPQRETIGLIACFVVAPAYRGQGIARQLLEAALAGFQAEGVRLVEAYPLVAAEGAAENCCGPLSLYLAAGFEKLGEREGSALVIKRLG